MYLLCDPSPILRSVKRAYAPTDNQHVGVAIGKPEFQTVPPALTREKYLASLPITIRCHHILYDDHAHHILVFSGALAFVAAMVERRPGDGSDFSE